MGRNTVKCGGGLFTVNLFHFWKCSNVKILYEPSVFTFSTPLSNTKNEREREREREREVCVHTAY